MCTPLPFLLGGVMGTVTKDMKPAANSCMNCRHFITRIIRGEEDVRLREGQKLSCAIKYTISEHGQSRIYYCYSKMNYHLVPNLSNYKEIECKDFVSMD